MIRLEKAAKRLASSIKEIALLTNAKMLRINLAVPVTVRLTAASFNRAVEGRTVVTTPTGFEAYNYKASVEIEGVEFFYLFYAKKGTEKDGER